MKQRILLLLGITTILSSTGMLSNTASAQLIDTTEAKRESLAITVYNNNLGVIRDVRRFSIKSGTNEVRMRDVPAQIDPTTVKITDHEHANVINVTEQNYEYDLVSQVKLLEKYIDHTVTLIDEKGMKIEGTLLSASSDDITLATPNGITMIPSLAKYQVQVAQLPAGLITRPTLSGAWNRIERCQMNRWRCFIKPLGCHGMPNILLHLATMIDRSILPVG
ncbi:MAG: DUF4140 domain-containing protein [Candidatus Kapaibacterium sp.]